jgi:hypothetical protein
MVCHTSVSKLSQFVLIGCIAIGSFLSAACGDDAPGSPTSPAGPSSVVLAIGQTVPVPDTTLSLRFNAVPNDSRCPADAICIQLGEAVVVMDALIGSSASRVELRTSDAGRMAQVGDYRIELSTLLPYPYSNHAIDPAEYRATVRVETQ